CFPRARRGRTSGNCCARWDSRPRRDSCRCSRSSAPPRPGSLAGRFSGRSRPASWPSARRSTTTARVAPPRCAASPGCSRSASWRSWDRSSRSPPGPDRIALAHFLIGNGCEPDMGAKSRMCTMRAIQPWWEFTARMRKSPFLRILTVDDEPLIRWSLANTLRDSGHEAVEAVNGATALRAVSEAALPFDVLLLDFRLPDSTDLELLAELRRLTPST